MTPEQLLEINALVAEKVMGIKPDTKLTMNAFEQTPGPALIKPYSTDIAAALEVVSSTLQKWHWQSKSEWRNSRQEHHYEVWSNSGSIGKIAEASEETAPLAICLAALKAVGVSIDQFLD